MTKKRNKRKTKPPLPPVMPPVKNLTLAKRMTKAEADIVTLRLVIDQLPPFPSGLAPEKGEKGDKGDKGDKGGFSFGG